MMTLQDVIDACKTVPEKYGKSRWFRVKMGIAVEAICPLAQEVLEDWVGTNNYERNYEREVGAYETSATRLSCSVGDVVDFTSWWDCKDVLPDADNIAGNNLRERGYRL